MKLAWRCAAAAAALSGALAISGTAQAQTSGLYAGVSLTQVNYKEEGFPSAKPIAIAGKFGKQFTPNIALEARFGIGVSDDEVDAGGIPVKLEVDNYYGVYGKAMLPVGAGGSIYGLLGFTRAKVTASAGGFSASASDDDVSFGIGGELNISPTAAITLEWARLIQAEGVKIEGLSIGVNFRF